MAGDLNYELHGNLKRSISGYILPMQISKTSILINSETKGKRFLATFILVETN